MTSIEEWTYWGYRSTDGRPMIEKADRRGATLGMLTHKRNDGSEVTFSWGEKSPAAEECAQAILLDALGEEAECKRCEGYGRLYYYRAAKGFVPLPPTYQTVSKDAIQECWVCQGSGHRQVPHQRFSNEHVSTWTGAWTLDRSEVLKWLAEHDAGTAGETEVSR